MAPDLRRCFQHLRVGIPATTHFREMDVTEGKPSRRRVGFVATRLAGTDGVSLEAVKWRNVLSDMGHECFCFCGETDWPAAPSFVIPEAHFQHPTIAALTRDLFDDYVRSTATSQKIRRLKDHLKGRLDEFVDRFEVDLLVAENVFSLPMNVPLGLALAELVAERSLPTIAHHHDFVWERQRYAVKAGDDYLRAAFPPTLRSVVHVVINSFASRQLALRTGESSVLIPNVMDFDFPPPVPDEYADDLRASFGLNSGEYLLLQPTRIVPRKRIEVAIELARRLEVPCSVLISHKAGDEGDEYVSYVRDYADLMKVRVIFAADRVSPERSRLGGGEKVYSPADVYLQADLVTYPSRIEGFGNAFLESVYFRRPIIMSAYDIFRADIEPRGFRVIEFEEFLTSKAVRAARKLLCEPGLTDEMVNHNYELGRQFYSYRGLEQNLRRLLAGAHRGGW